MRASAVRLTFLATFYSVAVTAGAQGTADGLPPSQSPTPARLRVASYAPTTPSTQNATAGLRVTGRTYDDFDRLSSETVQLQEGTTATLTYTYWNNGQRKTVTDAAGRVTFYEYDGRNRLARLTTNQGLPDERATAYAYWPDSLLKSVTKPDGTVTSYDYDRADRLTSIAVRKGETDILSYAYTYDRNGNRTKQVEANGGSAETTTYTYDDLNRLETVTYPDGQSVAYGYDDVGNRTAETERNPAGVVVSEKVAVFDAVNRLRTVTDAVNPANNATFAYDANGNLKTKTTAAEAATYTYDVRDLLVETGAGAAITARFAYDAFGRRYLKIGAEGIRQYLYDQTSLLEEFSETNVEVAKYDWDAERLVSLARLEEPRRYFHFDALGSVAALTDEAGGVAARYHYDAWGRHRDVAELDASANRFGFTGHYFDTETKLYYAKARYFDPDFGRFLTADSYLGELGDPPSLNRYVYAHDRPTFWTDPTGHAPGDWWDPRSYDGTTFRRQVVARTLGPAVRIASVAVGFSEAVGNNFFGLPRSETPGPDRRAGQISGDLISIPIGAAEAASGGGTALGGGTLTIATAGVGSPVTVPATAAGLAALAQGTYAATNASRHLSKAFEERGGNQAETVSENTPSKNDPSLTKMERVHGKAAPEPVGVQEQTAFDFPDLAKRPESRGVHPNTQRASALGSRLHSDRPGNLPDQLRELYPDTQFEFTKPGQPGQDVKVVGGIHPSRYPGSTWPAGVDRADFKPATPTGARTFRADQKAKWKERTSMLPYDPATGQLVVETQQTIK